MDGYSEISKGAGPIAEGEGIYKSIAGTWRWQQADYFQASYTEYADSGIGVPPPIPSWGQMVFEGREVLMRAWWVSTFPGIAIALTVVAYNLLGDALKDAFDPRQFM